MRISLCLVLAIYHTLRHAHRAFKIKSCQEGKTRQQDCSLAHKFLMQCPICAAKRNEYQAYEAEVFESLASLIKDAASLRVYLAAAMRVEAEAFARATT